MHFALGSIRCSLSLHNFLFLQIEPLVIELIDERDFIARFQAPEGTLCFMLRSEYPYVFKESLYEEPACRRPKYL